jgi:hypothetical protein
MEKRGRGRLKRSLQQRSEEREPQPSEASNQAQGAASLAGCTERLAP